MLGPLLKDVRTTYHISPEALVNGGLCTLGMLKKYERGPERPEKLLGDALWQRLGKSTEKFEVFLEQDEYELAYARARIQILIRQGKPMEAEEILRAYEGMKGTDKPLHRQFICLQRAELYRRKGKPYGEQMGVVQEGLRQTIPDTLSPEILGTHRFGVLELLLLGRYAFLLEEKSQEKAVQWYQGLRRYLTGEDGIAYDRADQYRLLPPVLYHHAIWGIRAGFYQLALELLTEGCRMLSERHAFLPLFIKMEELKLKVASKLGRDIPGWEFGCLRVLKEMMGEYPTVWGQNIYPDYPERTIHCVNTALRERRLANGKGFKDMTEGLDPRTLRAIESGERMPQTATKNMLFQEFGLSTQKYGGSLVTRRHSDYRDMVEMINCNYGGEHEQAEKIYKNLVRGLNKDEVINSQFANYWDIRLRYSRGKITKEKYQKELWGMLKKTLPKCEEIRVDCVLTEYEREVVKALAWDVEIEDAINLEKILLTQYQKFCNDNVLVYFFPEYYTTLVRCIGRIARLKRDYGQSESIFADILEQFYFLQNDFRLGSFFVQQFQLGEDIKKAQGLPPAENGDMCFQKMRYAYAIDKLYLCDKPNVGYIERCLDEYYGNKGEILQDLL